MVESPVKLSLCMIVKDEEAVLVRCINSVRDLVDEIIIVDTGSNDSTKDIAENLGARVYDYTWDDNFSKARNFSLDQAGGEWVLVLDADEILVHGGREDFFQLLADNTVEGYFIRIVSFLGEVSQVETGEDFVVRLFRNKPGYRFQGAIHEQTGPAIIHHAGAESLKRAPLTIYHDGYLSAVIRKKDKIKRNSMIIGKALAENPANPFLLFSLGCEYYAAGDYKGALSLFQQSLARIPAGEGYLPDLVIKTGLCLYLLGRTVEMGKLISHFRNLSPLSPELSFLSGLVNLDAGRLAEAEQDMKDCLAGIPVPSTHYGIGYHRVFQALGEIHEAKGALEVAVSYYFRALKAKPNYLYPLKKMLGIFKSHGKLPEIDGFLDFCPADTKKSLLRQLDWEQEADTVIYLIAGLTGGILNSDINVRPEFFNGHSLNLRSKTAALLAKAATTLAGCESAGAVHSVEVFEKIRQNIKDLLFCRGDWQ